MQHLIYDRPYIGRNRYGKEDITTASSAVGSLYNPYAVGSSATADVESPIYISLNKTSGEFVLASDMSDTTYIFAMQDSALIPTYIYGIDGIPENEHFNAYIHNNGTTYTYFTFESDGLYETPGTAVITTYFVEPDYDSVEDSYTYYGEYQKVYYYYDFINAINQNEYNILVNNELAGLSAYNNGSIIQESWNYPSITATLYHNGYPVDDVFYYITCPDIGLTGVTIDSDSGEFYFTNPVAFTNDNVEITVTAMIDSIDVASKIVNLCKVKAGADGVLTRRWLELSSTCVTVNKNTTPISIQPSTITAIAYAQINDAAPTIDSSSTISYWYDNDRTSGGVYSSPVVVDSNHDVLYFELTKNGAIWDRQSVGILKHGQNGGPGSNGSNNMIVMLFKRSASASINWTNDIYYYFSTKQLTPVPSGWSTIPPATNDDGDPVWVTAATASSTTDTDVIAYTEWASPVEYVENGINTATIALYKRSSTNLTMNDVPSDDYEYFFEDGRLEDPQEGTVPTDYDGWTRDIPAGSYAVYFIQATALSTGVSDYIEGGPTGDWSSPIKVFENGEKGLQGAAIRGPVDWFTDLGARRWCNGVLTSSLYPEDAHYIDIVYISTEDKYYVCTQSYNQSAVGSKTQADWDAIKNVYWQEADAQYNFVATNILLARNGKVNFLTGNEIYLMDSNQNISAGAKGCDSTSPIAFWAGADGSTIPISYAPFTVSYDGVLKATNADITGKIIAYGVAYTDVQTGDYSIESRNGIYNEGKFFARAGIGQSGGFYYVEGLEVNETAGTINIGAQNNVNLRSLANDITIQRGVGYTKEKVVSTIPNTINGTTYTPYNIEVVSALPANPQSYIIYYVI